MQPQNKLLIRPVILAGQTLEEARELIYSFARERLLDMQQNNQNLSTADFLDHLLDELQLSVIDCYKMHIDTVFAEAVNRHHNKELRALDRDDAPNLCSFIGMWLKDNQEDGPERRKNLILVDMEYPTTSQLNPNKIMVWRNTSKMLDIDKRQVVGVRKWIKSTLVGLSDDQIEDLAIEIDKTLTPLTELDVRHHSSYEFNAWRAAYESKKIRSCMSTFSDCEVGDKRTFTCFCTGYHNLPDNGLKLTVLYQNDVPVARTITFDDGDTKCYIAGYGDGRLKQWLDMNNYVRSDFLEDTILYSDNELLKPFVDGDDIVRGDHCVSDDGIYYWILSDYGEYPLDNTKAYATGGIECDYCDEVFGSENIRAYIANDDGKRYNICDRCFEIERNNITTNPN